MLVVGAALASGQNTTTTGTAGWLGLNHNADLILDSGQNRSVIANGVDIVGRFQALAAVIAAQSTTIANMDYTITTLKSSMAVQVSTNAAYAANVSSLASTAASQATTISAQQVTLGNLTTRLANLEAGPIMPPLFAITTVDGDLDCRKVFPFSSRDNSSSSINDTAAAAANHVNGILNGFCNETWVKLIAGSWNASFANMSSLDLHALVRVGGSVDLSFNRLTRIDLGTLTFIGGTLDLRNNHAGPLTQVRLGDLGHVGGKVYFFDTEFLIRGGILSSTPPISWTGKQVVDFGTGGVTTINATITISADTVDFGGVTSVTGNLAIQSVADLDLGSLRDVQGSCSILGQQGPLKGAVFQGNIQSQSAFPMRAVHFGSLTGITGDVHLDNNQISNIDFGSVVTIGHNVDLSDNILSRLSFGSLTSITGHLDVGANKLTEIVFDSLVKIGGKLILSENALTRIAFGSLSSTGDDVNVNHNALTLVTFGSLTSISGKLNLYNNNLVSVSFPANLTVFSIVACVNPGAVAILDACILRYGISKCDTHTTTC